MEKRTMIWIGAGVGGVLLLLAGWFIVCLLQGRNEAKAAAEEFETFLQAGDLDALTLCCYAYHTEETELLQDEDGQVQAVKVTPQQMAQRFGGGQTREALQGEEGQRRGEEQWVEQKQQGEEEAGWSERKEGADELLEMLMSYSHVMVSVGMVWGEKTSMTLVLTGPDIAGWMDSLTEEALLSFLISGEEWGAEIEAMLAAGEIPVRTVQMQVPMVKQDGKWRFQVAEEMEQAFYGGNYSGQ